MGKELREIALFFLVIFSVIAGYWMMAAFSRAAILEPSYAKECALKNYGNRANYDSCLKYDHSLMMPTMFWWISVPYTLVYDAVKYK